MCFFFIWFGLLLVIWLGNMFFFIFVKNISGNLRFLVVWMVIICMVFWFLFVWVLFVFSDVWVRKVVRGDIFLVFLGRIKVLYVVINFFKFFRCVWVFFLCFVWYMVYRLDWWIVLLVCWLRGLFNVDCFSLVISNIKFCIVFSVWFLKLFLLMSNWYVCYIE